MNKKHYVIFFEDERAKTLLSKDWARNNQHCFPEYDFNSKAPTSNTIDHYLVENLGFTLISDNEKFVCFKLTN